MHELDNTIGAAYLGMLTTSILYGVTSVQTFLYFRDSKYDTRLLKSIVSFLWILDTVHFIFLAHGLYFYLITNFGNLVFQESIAWTILAHIYITSTSDLIVRGFLTRRIFILCGSRKTTARILTAIITIFNLLTFASGCAFASKGFILKTYARLNEAAPLLYLTFGSTGIVVADASIAVSLCILLVQRRTGLESSRMDSALTKLMTFSINTGLLTSLCAIACLVTYAVWPQRLIYLGIYFTLSKMYLNAFLASLNARRTLRNQSYEVSMSIAFPALQTAPSTTAVALTSHCKCGAGPAEMGHTAQETCAY